MQPVAVPSLPHPGNIMVVDDNPANLKLLAHMLRRQGHEVHSFPLGTLALAEAARNPPDLILLDIEMPEMNGYEVSERLKTTAGGSGIPVIFLSALSEMQDQDKVEAFRSGAADYISKPFQLEEVLARVETHLHLHDLQRALKAQNENLERANAQLEDSNRLLKQAQMHLMQSEKMASLGQLVAGIAHEINNPLTFVLTHLFTVENLLARVVSELGTEASETACGMLETMSGAARQKGLRLSRHIEEGTPVRVVGDPRRLQQILLNLIGNAVKFTASGEVAVRVERDPDAGEPGALRFSVCDTGIGIPAEKIETIFDNFTQADSSTTREYGGTGLGLAISKKLVVLMAGRIWAESRVGQGTTMYFTAAFGISTGPQPAEIPVPKPPRTGGQELSERRILVAEDSEDNLFLLSCYLKRSAVDLDVAENGKVAVEKFQAAKYDLVLMDVQMPVMDGYTATQAIRAWEAHIHAKPTPILALSANACATDIEKSAAAGCTAHLSKPIAKETLLQAIEVHLGAPLAAREGLDPAFPTASRI